MARILVDLLSYTGTKGGMEVYTRELYRQFQRAGVDHEFIGYASREFMTGDYSWFPGRMIDSGISGENRWQWALGELFAVARAARKVEADLIHAPATLGPWRSRIPAVYTMHDMLYFRAPELMATPLYTEPVKWMEKRAARNATEIITISEASADDIVHYLGFPRDRLPVIHHGAPEQSHPSGTREQGLLLAVGNRLPHKNFAGIVRAMARIPAHRRPRLVITGSRGDDPLRPIVDELDLGDSVELRSWISDDELTWLYEHASALLIANFCDGFGLPIVEAQASGLPVLLSDIPVYHEVAGEGAGFFDTTDPDSIAAAMLRAATDPEWLRGLAENGRRNAERFSWEKTARETLAVFDRAITAAGRAKSRR